MKKTLLALSDLSKKHQLHILHNTKNNGLTIAEWNLLKQIQQGCDTQDKLAEKTGLDISTLSRQLKRLTEKEMIQKTAIGRDKRQLIYSVSDQGIVSFENIESLNDSLYGKLFKDWTKEELEMIDTLINRLDKSINSI